MRLLLPAATILFIGCASSSVDPTSPSGAGDGGTTPNDGATPGTSEDGSIIGEPGELPAAVGYVFVDTGSQAYERCVATLVAPTTIVTKWNCLSTDFAPTTNGGQAPSGAKVYFVGANDVANKASWIPISSVARYQRTARATLASPSKAQPIAIAKQRLAASDVGVTFMTAAVTGGVKSPTLKAGTTVVRAVDGQGMKAIYPTLADWANATETGGMVDYIIQGGPNGTEAASWQHPLLNGYEALTRGNQEGQIDVGSGLNSQGAPLLRKVGSAFEIVALDYDVVGTMANSGAGKNAVLATYYSTITEDIAAFFGGKTFSENHCLGVPVNTGICLNQFAITCTEWEGVASVDDLEETMSAFCGTSSCVVKANAGSGIGNRATCQ